MIVCSSLLSVVEINTIAKNDLFSSHIPVTIYHQGKSGQDLKKQHCQEAQRSLALWSAPIDFLSSLS